MSAPARDWAWQQKVKGDVRVILLALADLANKEGVAWPNRKTLMEKTHFSKSTLIRYIRTLERLSFVVVVMRFRENGSQTSNEYHLNMGGCQHVGTPPVSVRDTPPVSTCDTPLYEPYIEPYIEPKDTGKPGTEDLDLDIQEALAQYEPLGKEEILDNAPREKGKLDAPVSATGCGYIWKQFRRTAGAKGFQGELLFGELKMLKDSRGKLGQDNFNEAVWAVMSNWIGFTKFAESKGAAYQLPQHPKVGFFRKFCTEAVEFAASNGASQKIGFVKLSAKTGKQLTKPTDTIDTPDSEEALKSLLALDEGEE